MSTMANNGAMEEERFISRSDKSVVMDVRIESPRSPDVHVEIVVPMNCPVPLKKVRSDWISFLSSGQARWHECEIDASSIPQELRRTMQRLRLVSDVSHASVDSKPADILFDANHATIHVHCFVLSQEESALEELEPTHDGDDFVTACDNLTLPHKTLDGLWDSLIFKASIKSSLLNYAQSALLFSDLGVSNHVVHWNRLLLLTGPPGTGKTSLCRALAQKLAIRLSHRFQTTHLLEIQSHSLFSKWFSTSGKLIHRLFDMVKDMVQDCPDALVCVLLDEVESLAASRSELGGDPADSMRAVNALLTSLDRLKVFPNVLIMATTNMTNKVDGAFCDRADLQLYIGNPIQEARSEILRSCCVELQRVGLVQDGALHLAQIASASEGKSGRSLRRLALQAHALHLSHEPTPIPVDTFVEAMLKTIHEEELTD